MSLAVLVCGGFVSQQEEGGWGDAPRPKKTHAPLLNSKKKPPCFYRNSSIMLCSGGRPTHALKKFSSAARCLLKALTTGAPWGTSGAFVR